MNSTNGSSHSHFNPDAVHAKYREERDKRLFPGRAATRDLTGDNLFATYREDPSPPSSTAIRSPRRSTWRLSGEGSPALSWVPNSARRASSGVRLIDQAGGIGGTWYWNRYPGVMCDVESYIYMPMLEDLDYVPTRKYAFGDEIRQHLERIADKYDLFGEARCSTPASRPPSGTKTAPAGSSTPTAAM